MSVENDSDANAERRFVLSKSDAQNTVISGSFLSDSDLVNRMRQEARKRTFHREEAACHRKRKLLELLDERDNADDLIARAKVYLAGLQSIREELNETLNREIADSETTGSSTLDVVSKLPTAMDCTICQTEIDVRHSALILQVCGHAFHSNCASKIRPHRLPASPQERRNFNQQHPERQVDFVPGETYAYRRCPNCCVAWETPWIATIPPDESETFSSIDETFSLPNAQPHSQP